jgi:hypothetical protein
MPKKVSNKKYLKEVSEMPCLLCGIYPCKNPHHITTRGAGGGDERENIAPLCTRHHREIHDVGIFSFIDKYKSFLLWLIRNNRTDIISKYEWTRKKIVVFDGKINETVSIRPR